MRANSIILESERPGFYSAGPLIFWLGARQASEYLDAFCVCV